IMGSDPRIGRAFLNAGLGYGGYCFPKDIPAFRAQAEQLGYAWPLLDEIVRLNQESLTSAFEKIKAALWNLEEKRVVLFGLAYKPGTDDIRESPALKLCQMLIAGGASVAGFDPKANETAKSQIPELATFDDPYDAAEGADCVVIATEWPEFSELDFPRLKRVLSHPIVVDTRNVLDPVVLADAGFTYIPTGRPPVNL
ncbi:MAG: UDP binding domain-containing protein, partial [Acidimicrobiia bacterium]